MRRRLVLVFAAVSMLVAMAFVVPLGFLVQRTAEDRAIDAARADAAFVVPSLVAGGTSKQVESAVAATESGRSNRMTVLTDRGWTVGPDIATSPRVETALELGTSEVGTTAGGAEVVAAVATGPNELSAIRVFVPDSQLRAGLWRAWAILAGVGFTLVGISVLVADRLAQTVVRPTQELAEAAQSLGDGDLAVSVDPSGPAELVELGTAFNDLGGRVSTMLLRERELVAELSHRLRTPLTKLRLRADHIQDDEMRYALRADVEEMTDLVNELIAEARGTLTEPDTCDLGEVVTERAAFWQVLAEDQNRPWHFAPATGDFRVPINRTDLTAAVDVLLDNVFSHTPEGSAVVVGFASDGRQATAWVGDAGAGIDNAALTRGTSSAGSTGLGLDIARHTAQRGGGDLVLGQSRLGGTEVALWLPLTDSASK